MEVEIATDEETTTSDEHEETVEDKYTAIKITQVNEEGGLIKLRLMKMRSKVMMTRRRE